MKVHILEGYYDCEGSEIVGVYFDHALAQKRMDKLNRMKLAYLKEQRALEEAGSDEAWEADCPHGFDGFTIASCTVIGGNSTAMFTKQEDGK